MAIDFPAVRQAHPLADFCRSRGIELKRRGSAGTLVGLCPLHYEKTASFHVYPDEHFYCFGCGQHGDVIALCSKLDGLTVVGAAKKLGNYSPETKMPSLWRPRGVRPAPIRRPRASLAPGQPDAELERARSKILGFGKHRGKRLDQVPKSYLGWCLRECSSKSLSLREAIRLLLKRGGAR